MQKAQAPIGACASHLTQCRTARMASCLYDLDLFHGVLLDFGEAHGEHAVFQYGLDVFFFYRHGQCYTAAKFTPVALLHEVVLNLVVIASAECSADAERVVGDADVEVAFVDTGRAGFDDEFFFCLVDVYRELAR